ncbi:MAG TPA: aldehyde dehydrogenase family protein [Candidatus Acidoferrum sp.]|nr:aldehyde dehydrogenase family protein [Candidatus Acidoferrum sp.]
MNAAADQMRLPAVNDADPDATAMVARAMTAARAAQSRWSRTPLARRLELIRELRRLIAERALQLAEASASARKRPALESLTAEVLPLAEACRFLEREARGVLATRRFSKRGRPVWLAGVRSEIHREALGVILVIGPGNYPLLLPGVQVVQALAAGNAVLLKPGLGGAPAAHALAELVVRAGFDPQLVAVLPESNEAARCAISARPDKVLFTGSAATGEKILGQLALHVIPATMELSGCDAVLVRADANLDLVVRALAFGLRLNAGATCMSPKRVLVHRSIATELEGRLAQDLCRSRDNGCRPFHSPGLSAPTVTERLRPVLDDALARGAHVIAGEIKDDGSVTFPLVLGGVSASSRLLREDIFAPVLALVTVVDDHEAVLRANDCPFALTASIFSRDESAAGLLAAQIKTGAVTINDLIIPTADARLPFGGRRRSGFGVTRGAEGLLELTAPKVVTISRAKFRPAFDSAQPGDEALFNAYLSLAHGRGLKSRWAALVSLIHSISRRPRLSSQDNT